MILSHYQIIVISNNGGTRHDARHGVVTHEQVVIPVICFAVCITFQTWEFAGKHDETTRVRSLFAAVREGWVKVMMYFGN